MPAVADSNQAEPTTSTPHSPDIGATPVDVDKVKLSSNPLWTAIGNGATVVEGTMQPSDPSEPDASPQTDSRDCAEPNPKKNRWGYSGAHDLRLRSSEKRMRWQIRAVELVTNAARGKDLLEQFGMSTKPPPITRARSQDRNCRASRTSMLVTGQQLTAHRAVNLHLGSGQRSRHFAMRRTELLRIRKILSIAEGLTS